MKAKLIKRYNGDFYLIDENNKITSHHHLSKQNCDEIFEIVDVEKLAEETLFEFGKKPIKSNINDIKFGIKVGLEKAMELNKDKVFTLEDMMNCWNKALKFQEHKQTFGEYIQSLQKPTEIEVEIEMEEILQLKKRAGGFTNMGKPKLDSEECLILKRK